MNDKKILFVGESYTGIFTYVRGADYVTLPGFSDMKGTGFCEMLSSQGFQVNYMPTHEVAEHFPQCREELAQYDAVILSDVGSNTMLKNPASGKRINRLELLREYVSDGGGLLMCGGYFSFSGIGNTARYGMTSLAEVLPVDMLNYDDRIECPQGVVPAAICKAHPVLSGIDIENWPVLCGYNKVVAKREAEVLACFGEDPFIAVMKYKKGRSAAFTSDCTPNWATEEFLSWDGYPVLFRNIMAWLTGGG